MKLELKIEASGVQVYAYEINDEAKNLLEENAKNGSPRRGIEIVEELGDMLAELCSCLK